jgi:hypothetical protein
MKGDMGMGVGGLVLVVGKILEWLFLPPVSG